MFECLNDRDQDMVIVGACRQVNNMPVFIVGDINENLNLTISDGKFLRGDVDPVDNDDDNDNDNDNDTFAEEKTMHDASSASIESQALDDKELKKLKYARQRELDNQKRMKTIRERHKLYHLIHSNEITAIFHEKAKLQNNSSNFTFASGTDSVSNDPFALKSLDDSQTLASTLDQTLDQSSIVTFDGPDGSLDGSPDGRIYNEIQSFDDSTVAGGLSPMSSVILPPNKGAKGNQAAAAAAAVGAAAGGAVGELSPMSTGTRLDVGRKGRVTKSIEEVYKEAEEKLRRDANPLMQTLSISDIAVRDIHDSGSFIDKQDPGVTLIVDNHILKTERIKEGGTSGTFSEVFSDIQLNAERVKSISIEIEVGNIDSRGNTKSSLGFANIKLVDALKTRNTWVDLKLNLTRPSQGTISFKAMLSDVHELKGFPNIHIYNNSVDNNNRSYKKNGGEGGSGVTNMLRRLKELVIDM